MNKNISLLLFVVITTSLLGTILILAIRGILKKRGLSFDEINCADLQEMLEEGENEKTVFFKKLVDGALQSELSSRDMEWLKSFVALCNSGGGYIIFGIDENCYVVGIDGCNSIPPVDCTNFIKQKIQNYIGLQHYLHYKISMLSIDTKTIAVIQILPSNKFIYLNYHTKKQYYIRMDRVSVQVQGNYKE